MPTLKPSLSSCWGCGVPCNDLLVTCSMCRGKCSVHCPIAYSPSPSHGRCPRCSGHRYIPCPRCQGTGKQRIVDFDAVCDPCADLIDGMEADEDVNDSEVESEEDEEEMEEGELTEDKANGLGGDGDAASCGCSDDERSLYRFCTRQ